MLFGTCPKWTDADIPIGLAMIRSADGCPPVPAVIFLFISRIFQSPCDASRVEVAASAPTPEEPEDDESPILPLAGRRCRFGRRTSGRGSAKADETRQRNPAQRAGQADAGDRGRTGQFECVERRLY